MKKLIAIVLSVSMAIGLVAQAVSLPMPAGSQSWLYELFGSDSRGTTYYVDAVSGNDANDGTSKESAWQTIDKVNSVIFGPGDEILFKSGCTFVGQLMPQGSGSKEEGVIRMDKYGEGALPVINAKGSLENRGAVIQLINQEYWEISNLSLTNPATGTAGARVGVLVTGKEYGTLDHIYVTNCTINNVVSDLSKSESSAKSSAGGDLWYGTGSGGGVVFHVVAGGEEVPTAFNDILVDNNTIRNLGRSGTGVHIDTSYKNIYQQGYKFESDQADWFPHTNILISNNDISYTTNAIQINGCDGAIGNGVVIENNLVYHPDRYDSNAAVWFALCNEILVQYNEVYALDNGGMNDCGAFDYDGGVTNSIMQYNYTHHNRGESVMVCNVHWSSAWESTNTTDNIYRYNISENDLWGANLGHGRLWVQKGAENSWFYNNLIYVAEGMPGNNISVTAPDKNVYMYNNLFINLSEETTWRVSDGVKLHMDNNAYYGYVPTADSWTLENKGSYAETVGASPAKEFFGGENSVYMTTADPLPIVSNEYIGKAVYEGKNTAGTEAEEIAFLRPGAADIDAYLAGFKLNLTADWSAFGGTNPLVDAGRRIENNSHLGLKDFFENTVMPDEIPDIGVHETGTNGIDVQNPDSFSITATATDFDEIEVSWNAVNDNVGVSHYVVYVDGEPIDRIYAESGKQTYTHTVSKLIGSTGPLVDYLLADTEYEITVRAFDYTANSVDSNTETVRTESADAKESTLIVSESGTYGLGEGATAKFYADQNVPCTEFEYNDFVAPRFKVTNGYGDPVEDAWVSVLVSADGQENNNVIGMLTDSEGYAQPAFYAEIYIGENVNVNIDAREVERVGYTLDKNASADNMSLDVTVKGYDQKVYGNLAKNGDFDQYYGDDMAPTSWGVAVSNATEAVRVAEESGPDGGNALEISAEETYTALLIQNVSGITPGVYTLTMYVKNTAPGASITVGGKTASITTTERWTQISVPNVNVTGTSVQLSIEVAGTPTTYTLIDKIELSQNLLKNSLFKEKTADYNLPSDWYFETENGTLDTKAVTTGSFGSDASFKAIQPLYWYGKSILNAIKFQSDKEFDVTLGQDVTNIPEGTYTFAMTTLHTGNLEGTVTISGYGGDPVSTEIGMSSGESITKIAGINITTGKAKVEINVKGEGATDAEEYIIIQTPSLAARSDFPEEAKRTVFAGDNLLDVINPSFENDNGVTTQAPQGWKSGWTEGRTEFIATDEAARTGKYSAKITLYDGGAVSIGPTLSFNDLPTGYYTVGCWVKGTHKPKFTGAASSVGWDSNSISGLTVNEDEWTYFSLKNLKVTDGKFSLGFWCDAPAGQTQYFYVDDIELYMQENLLDNSGFENGASTDWAIGENVGYSELRTTTAAKDGNRAARIVLPGTPSTAELLSETSLINMFPGTYTFTAWVKGSSALELFAEADGGAIVESVSATGDVDNWQEVSLTLNITDSFKKLGVRAKNPQGVTSSYLAIDGTSLVRKITAADIAALVGDLNPVKLTENAIKLPTVREGFTIELVESSNTAVVALDGSATHGEESVIVTLKFKVTNNADPTDVAYVTSTVKVLGYGAPEEENNNISDGEGEQQSPPESKPVVTPTIKGDDDWDLGLGGNWSTDNGIADGNAGDGDGDKKPTGAGIQINWIIILLLILAIIMVLAVTFMILLVMKKKSEEKQNQQI